MDEVYCIAKFNATEGNIELLGEKLQELSTLNKEEGCEFYVPCKDIRNNNTEYSCWDFTFIEKFKSVEDFNNHCKEDYVNKFFQENGVLILDKDISLFTPLGRN